MRVKHQISETQHSLLVMDCASWSKRTFGPIQFPPLAPLPPPSPHQQNLTSTIAILLFIVSSCLASRISSFCSRAPCCVADVASCCELTAAGGGERRVLWFPSISTSSVQLSGHQGVRWPTCLSGITSFFSNVHRTAFQVCSTYFFATDKHCDWAVREVKCTTGNFVINSDQRSFETRKKIVRDLQRESFRRVPDDKKN